MDGQSPLSQSVPMRESHRSSPDSAQPNALAQSVVVTRVCQAAPTCQRLPSPPAETFGGQREAAQVLDALYLSVCGAMCAALDDFDASRELRGAWEKSVERARQVAKSVGRSDDAQGLAALAALALFTSAAEHGDEARTVHAVLNSALRHGGGVRGTGTDGPQRAWEPYLWYLVTGLRAQRARQRGDGAEDEPQTVYRGVGDAEFMGLVARAGSVVVLDRFMSTSASEDTARSFGRWVVRVVARAPLPAVGAASLCPEEREVLFEPGTEFVVSACKGGIELAEKKYARLRWALSSDAVDDCGGDDDDVDVDER